MKLTTAILSLFEKAGIPATNEHLSALIENAALTEVEVEPVLFNTLDSRLMTKEIALQHPDIRKEMKKTFFAEAYNGLDAELNDAFEKYGIAEEDRTKFLNEKSSTKRAVMLFDYLHNIKKPDANANKDLETLRTQVNTLNGQITTLKKEHETAIKKKESEYNTALLNHSIMTDLSGFQYAFPKEMDRTIIMQTAKSILDAQLAARGAVVVIEGGVKKLKTAEGTDFVDESNRTVSYDDFVKTTLANAKVLQASKPDNPNPPNPIPPVNPNEKDPNAHLFHQAANDDLKNFEDATKAPVGT